MTDFTMPPKMQKPEIYVSYDIETNGDTPGLFSMLSYGAAAFTIERGLVDTITHNLECLPGAGESPRTMQEFWSLPEHQAIYFKTRVNMVTYKQAMFELDAWLRNLAIAYRPVNVAGPAGFDFTFLSYYMNLARGSHKHCLSHSCLDIRSYIAGMMKANYRETGKRSYKSEWFDTNLPHTHIALDDATEQGAILYHAMRENLGLPRQPFILKEASGLLVPNAQS